MQPALTALFQLDERFGQVVATAGEPLIGLMRLAWWREALEKLDRDPAPAEPLLQTLVADVLPHGASGSALADIEDGWSALLDGEPDDATVIRHGRERGGNLFGAAATILRADDSRLRGAGEIWALTDLGFRHSSAPVRALALTRARELAQTIPPGRWPRASRPLAMLFLLAARDCRAEGRVQGSPSRLLRALTLRITGL